MNEITGHCIMTCSLGPVDSCSTRVQVLPTRKLDKGMPSLQTGNTLWFFIALPSWNLLTSGAPPEGSLVQLQLYEQQLLSSSKRYRSDIHIISTLCSSHHKH